MLQKQSVPTEVHRTCKTPKLLKMLKSIGGDTLVITGYWWVHVTTVHTNSTPLEERVASVGNLCNL